MMLRYSLEAPEHADRIERAVSNVLDRGLRTGDIAAPGTTTVGTVAMGDAVLEAIRRVSVVAASRRRRLFLLITDCV